MKIISFEAENYKRLRAVQITPDGDLVVIGGRNAQGKSSVMDAIWAALGGREGNKLAKPIRDGEDKARVRLDLGDMIVTRTWSGSSSTVKVESAEGAVFKSPQTLLDALVGKLSFDPLAFTRLDSRRQREALLEMVDLTIDLDALDAERAALFDKRTSVGRDGKAIGNVTVDETLPTTEASASDLIARIRSTQDQKRAVVEAEEAVNAAGDRVARIRTALAEAEADYDAANEHARSLHLPSDDVADLEAQLATIEGTNAAIRANNAAREQAARKDALRDDYEALTQKISTLDQRKADALTAAKFPVAGLGFGEDGVTFQGVPFGQASSAEQIRVSLAMAIAANPKLRVVRIMDGSLLDDDSMRMVAEAAAEHDMQVWVERVGTGDVGVIIEDGEVAG